MDIKLTGRELEILMLIIGEKTNAEIAESLFLSKHTVDNHRRSIMAKTQSKSAIGLLKWAMGHGLTAVSIQPFDARNLNETIFDGNWRG